MHLTLHLTRSCNMHCDYCYSPPVPGEEMTFEIGKNAIDFAALQNNGSCGIILFGGEPLLCKNLIKRLVHYSRGLERKNDSRFHFKLTTNGLLLDPTFIRFSIEQDILIAMSCDGIQEAHDAHRCIPDGGSSHEIIHNRLKHLILARPYSSVLMTVNPDTAQYVSESISFLLNLRCRYIILSLNFDGHWTESSFRNLRKEFEKVADLYIQWTRKGKKFYFSPFEVKLSSHINKHNYRKERCELAKNQISVDPEGFLFPCVQFTSAGKDSDWCIGHISEGIDEKKRKSIYDASQSEKEMCEGCAIEQRCNHTCGCLNWQTTGSINRISPILCAYERMVIKIADRIGRVLYKERNPHFLHKHYNATYPVLSLIEESLETE